MRCTDTNYHHHTLQESTQHSKNGKQEFVAYLGLQNSQFPRLLQIAETFDQPVTDELLADGARDREEANLWIQLSKDLHYLLINVCQGQAAVLCRQHTLQAVGLETWRQLHRRFFNSTWYTQCRVPYKAFETTVQRKQI